MKTAGIRELKHDTTTVLEWVAAGECVEIQKRGRPVAVLSPPVVKPASSRRPNFSAHLKAIYGNRLLPLTATELLAQERGER